MPPSEFRFQPIGIIHTPFTERAGTPIQGVYAPEACGTVELFPQFQAGLDDVEGFSYLYLIYVFDRAQGYDLRCKPFRDDTRRGVFATRAPRRPNAIGLSVVRLLERVGAVLHVAEVDILDLTPLLDIKPYVPMFDQRAGAAAGWLEGSADRRVADDRFES
jgi:tRNA-Thr(GGU) m(6)t(6)A37 methyltransferase TsaA